MPPIPRPSHPWRYVALTAATVTFGLTWAFASEVVVLSPGKIGGRVAFAGETVTQLYVQAIPATGGQASERSFAAPSITDYDLTVEAGALGGAGADHRLQIYAYLANAPGASTYQFVQRMAPVHVEPTAGGAPQAVADFTYPDTGRAAATRVDARVQVTGGQLAYVDLYSSSSGTGESYSGHTSFQPAAPGGSILTWIPTIGSALVTVYGTAYLQNADGTTTSLPLPQQQVLPGTTMVWALDLSATGTLSGSVAVSPRPANLSVTVQYYGACDVSPAPTCGVSGSTRVGPDGLYTVDLPVGDYDVYAEISVPSPGHYADTRSERITVRRGESTFHPLLEEPGALHVPYAVSGMLGNADVSSAQSLLFRDDPGQRRSPLAIHYTPVASQFDYVLPSGRWRPYFTTLNLNRSAGAKPALNATIYRYHNADGDFPAFTMGDNATLTTPPQAFTLVETDVFFQVASGAAVTSPQGFASRLVFNPDGSLRSQSHLYAFGQANGAVLTMVGEPGTYRLDARAMVNGTLTRFPGDTLRFGVPVETNPGPQAIDLTPDHPDGLIVNLTGTVASGGRTTVVETPIGPEPPTGFRAVCRMPDGSPTPDALSCVPTYYDIKTTATWGAETVVCIQRKFVGVVNAAADFLRLWHYNDARPEGDKWEPLPPPDGAAGAAFDCSLDSARCGCASDEACGISNPVCSEPPPPTGCPQPVNVFLVCGVTHGFSPFAIFQGTLAFSSSVGGVESVGPTGPIQTWTVPGDGTYRITARGASGGSPTGTTLSGGRGAEVAGDFALHAGDVLQLLIGQPGTGTAQNAGGGGGTFVVKNGVPLLVAGGGGGVRVGATVNGRDAGLTSAGVAGSTSGSYASGFVAGGAGGSGGARAASFGSGGGGWLGNGASDGAFGEGGFAFTGAGAGKGGAGKSCGGMAPGGFGGGGAGNGCYGGGGGGGYSGGGGGRVAGGGGSWNTGANPTAVIPTSGDGRGRVVIDLLR